MGALTLLVTGAGGFIGRHVVAAARARGHIVRPLVRHPTEDPDAVQADLLHDPVPLQQGIHGCDAIVHAAAAMSGPAERQMADTVDATQALFRAIADSGNSPRIVLISSVSVYAHDALPEGGRLDEGTALERSPEKRDIYAQAKLAQEAVASTMAAEHGLDLTILRPGAVFGAGRLWNAHFGLHVGPVFLRLSEDGTVPVIYVKNCAEGIVSACEISDLKPVINMIEPDAPSRHIYLARLGRKRIGPTIPLPWEWVMPVARLIARVPALHARMPGLLRPEILRARMLPLRYDTSAYETLLQGRPRVPFDIAIAESLRAEAVT